MFRVSELQVYTRTDSLIHGGYRQTKSIAKEKLKEFSKQ
jgi:hypothetical protein